MSFWHLIQLNVPQIISFTSNVPGVYSSIYDKQFGNLPWFRFCVSTDIYLIHGFPVTYFADQSIHGSWLVFSKKRARAYREEYFTSSSSVRYFCNMFSISPFSFKIWGTGKVNMITSAFVLTSFDSPLDVPEAPAQSMSPLRSTEWSKVEEWKEPSKTTYTGGKLWRDWAQFTVY